ncbi:MAG: GlxA family transcriptional regulator [Alphaproteobacteria bacterium]|nr:MAG: GlxA family transcriptional regulator [Alphaproteobacteria bacterium]
MGGSADGTGPRKIGFLLLPQFSMLSFFNAVETLRVANRIAARDLYSWHVFSSDGGPVAASNGMTVVAEAGIAAIPHFPAVFVCTSFEPERCESRALLAWLRRLDRQGACLGAMETGAYILARAGLLAGYRATLHWENAPAFVERFPEVEVTNALFEVDRNRLTCSGGTASLDLMLHMIAADHGRDLSVAVSEMLLHTRVRTADDHRRMALGQHLSVRHPRLLRVVEAMHEHLEEPLGLDALARMGGMSRRQLERLFRLHLGETPTGYYLKLRLRRARQFIEQTDMRVLDISLACGFTSAPYFSRAYRAQFGCTPREDRQRFRCDGARTGRLGGAVLGEVGR